MSWLFGYKSQPVPEFQGQPEPISESDGQKAAQQKVGAQTAYSFDSTALERAANAAKTLESSSNARQAFEITRMQEVTRQQEIDLQRKQLDFKMATLQAENARLIEEERRKTIAEETKHARARAEYQDQLARKRQQEEAALKQKLQDESLRRQEESVQKQEAIRKATIEHELKLRHKFDLDRIEAQVKAEARAARENRDVNLEMMKAQVVEKIRTMGSVVGAGLQEFINDRTKVATAVGGLSALAVGWYSAKHGTGVISRYVEARLGKPSLVRETSRLTPIELIKHPIRNVKKLFKRREDPLKGIVLDPELETRLREIAINTKNTKQNFGFFRNVLFYGPPGTGKTMFAKSLARHSGIDYAILAGGDVAPMGKEGVSAIHGVFDWAETSRRGLILFIDEADAFLRKRSIEHISEDMRTMLNSFLYRTGERSRKFMLVVASNQPEQFDWAVNDRLHELVKFDLPGDLERERILLQYFWEFIADPATSGSRKQRLKLAEFDWIKKVKEITPLTKGMSGRELSNMMLGIQAKAYASEDGILTLEMIEQCTASAIAQHNQKSEWLALERAKAGSDAENARQNELASAANRKA